MSYIFISHFLREELDALPMMKRRWNIKKDFTRSIRAITDGPDEDGWIRTRGNILFFPNGGLILLNTQN